MFDGEKIPVTLEFPNYCLRSVHNKFGYRIKVDLISGEGAEAIERTTVNVAVSRYFYSWVGESLGCVKIISPQSVKDGFNEYAKQMYGAAMNEKQPAAATTDCPITAGKTGYKEKRVSNK